MKLEVKDMAPDFSLLDQDGNEHTLKEYKGRWLLLYFYPKDHTPGCIKEACNFRDNISELQKKAEVVGISGDSVKSHKGFQNKYKLPFNILADPEKQTIKAYGTDGLILKKRTSFLISPEGIIEKIYKKVNPELHTQEIIEDLNKKV